MRLVSFDSLFDISMLLSKILDKGVQEGNTWWTHIAEIGTIDDFYTLFYRTQTPLNLSLHDIEYLEQQYTKFIRQYLPSAEIKVLFTDEDWLDMFIVIENSLLPLPPEIVLDMQDIIKLIQSKEEEEYIHLLTLASSCIGTNKQIEAFYDIFFGEPIKNMDYTTFLSHLDQVNTLYTDYLHKFIPNYQIAVVFNDFDDDLDLIAIKEA